MIHPNKARLQSLKEVLDFIQNELTIMSVEIYDDAEAHILDIVKKFYEEEGLVEAVKFYKNYTGFRLKKAKQDVEAYADRDCWTKYDPTQKAIVIE